MGRSARIKVPSVEVPVIYYRFFVIQLIIIKRLFGAYAFKVIPFLPNFLVATIGSDILVRDFTLPSPLRRTHLFPTLVYDTNLRTIKPGGDNH